MTSEELKSYRKDMGYTQEGLARTLGVTRKTINEMENGGPIDKRTELAVVGEIRRVRLVAHEVWVEETRRGTYAVVQRMVRGIERPDFAHYRNSALELFGEFKRRDHAYRWCAAVQRSDNARNTRKLRRQKDASLAVLAHT